MGSLKLLIIVNLLLWTWLNATSIYGQDSAVIDSLLRELKEVNSDTAKFDLLMKLSEEYRLLGSDKAGLYAKQALNLAETSNYSNGVGTANKFLGILSFYNDNYPQAMDYFARAIQSYQLAKNRQGISDCYKKMGLTKAYQDDYQSAIEHYEQALEIDKELDNKQGISVCYNDIGVMYNYQGNHEKSIEYQVMSLDLSRQMNDKRAIASRLINLGASYDEQSNYQGAIECYREALDLKTELADKRGISNCYNNLGEVCHHQGDYRKAIEYYEKSFVFDKELNDSEGMAISMHNIGNVYGNLNENEQAIVYFKKSLQLADSIENKRIVVNNLNQMGALFLKMGKYKEANEYLNDAVQESTQLGDKSVVALSVFHLGEVQLAQQQHTKALSAFQKAWFLHQELGEQANAAADLLKIGKVHLEQGDGKKSLEYLHKGLSIAKQVGSKENIRLASGYLSEAYAEVKNYQKAYLYSVLFKQIHDSIFTIESKKQLSSMESRFELERKEQQIALQNAMLDKQSVEIRQQALKENMLIGIISGILFVVLLIIVGYLRIKRANRIISHQMHQIEEANEELHQANEELQISLELNTQQREQIERTNKEITDSIYYAKSIQGAILPGVQKINSLLPNHFVLNKPKHIISGDFYWITETDQKLILAIADCTGHGVPGAFMSMLGISLLNEIVTKEGVKEVNEILNRMRTEVIHSMNQEGKIGEQREGFEVGICSYDLLRKKLYFSGARVPLYLIRKSGLNPIINAEKTELNGFVLYEIKGDKMPVAQYSKMDSFHVTEIDIFKGDCLYLFTDGFADQFGGAENKRLSYKPFKELLLKNCQMPMDQQKSILETAFNNWQHTNDQIDDVLVLGVVI